MKSKSKWANSGVWLYYVIGFSYYVYQWFIIGGGVGLLASLVGGYFATGAFWPMIVGGIGLLSVVLLAVGLGIAFSNWRKRYKNINAGVKILSSRTVYSLLPDNKYLYRRELDLLASIHSIDHFTHVFSWTGHGAIVPSVDNGCQFELVDDETSPKKKLRVYFDRPRAKGDQFKIAYQMEMTDTEGKARNFLRTTMHEKIRRMTNEVIFPENKCPVKYKRLIFMSDVAEIPIFEEEILLSREQYQISWHNEKPRLGYNYCISW